MNEVYRRTQYDSSRCCKAETNEIEIKNSIESFDTKNKHLVGRVQITSPKTLTDLQEETTARGEGRVEIPKQIWHEEEEIRRSLERNKAGGGFDDLG